MGGSLRDLSPRQRERLKSELAEVIIANFCYPSFLDYRLNLLRTRPVDRRKRQEVWAYVNSINLGALQTMDVSSMDFRRFVERVFLRYIEMNRGLIGAISARQVVTVRAQVPHLAVSVARGLADYLTLGEASNFGRARAVESWATLAQGQIEPSWEQIERSTQLLQTTLVYLRTHRDTGPAPAVTGSGPRGAHVTDISSFPTRLLTPPLVGPFAALAGASNGAMDGHGVQPALSNGAAHSAENGNASLQDMPEEDPERRPQFWSPNRSRTASRPLDGPLSQRTDPTPDRPQPPAPPDQPASVEPPAPPSSTGPMLAMPQPSVPLQSDPPPAGLHLPPGQPLSSPAQPPASGQPAPVAPSLPPEDAWQSLLWPAGTAEPSESAAESPLAPADAPAALPVDEIDQADLLELPESFGLPSVLDLPPDLAELYGDYLRDSRTGALDLAPAHEKASEAATPQDARSAAPALDAETDAEIDQLFNALASHVTGASRSPSPQADDYYARPATPPVSPALPQQSASSSPLQRPPEPYAAGNTPAGDGERASSPLGRSGSGPLPAAHQPSISPHDSVPLPSAPGASGALSPRPAASRPLSPPERPSVPLPDAPGSPAPSSPPTGQPGASGNLTPPVSPSKPLEGDVMIFAQLQHQVTTWIKMAAVSHQIEIAGRDAADLVSELRRNAAMDEAELQVIESLVALCQRVTTAKQATVDDYKQAMMLYLLHHRSRLAF